MLNLKVSVKDDSSVSLHKYIKFGILHLKGLTLKADTLIRLAPHRSLVFDIKLCVKMYLIRCQSSRLMGRHEHERGTRDRQIDFQKVGELCCSIPYAFSLAHPNYNFSSASSGFAAAQATAFRFGIAARRHTATVSNAL